MVKTERLMSDSENIVHSEESINGRDILITDRKVIAEGYDTGRNKAIRLDEIVGFQEREPRRGASSGRMKSSLLTTLNSGLFLLTLLKGSMELTGGNPTVRLGIILLVLSAVFLSLAVYFYRKSVRIDKENRKELEDISHVKVKGSDFSIGFKVKEERVQPIIDKIEAEIEGTIPDDT